MQKTTSTEIKLALKKAELRRATYFITECKTCSTYFPDPQGMLQFDALSIRKSYTKPCIVGYEIKVSRSDFRQDNKWHLYLQYCNEFYFVVPKGLIQKDEIPINVGLIYYNPEKKTLRTARKAQYRKIAEPVGIYKYIIYSRLEEDRIPFYEERAEYARGYLQDKEDKRYVGEALGTRLAKDLSDAQEKLESLKHAEQAVAFRKQVYEILKEIGLIYSWAHNEDSFVLNEMRKALTAAYPKEIDDLEYGLKNALNIINTIRERAGKENEDG